MDAGPLSQLGVRDRSAHARLGAALTDQSPTSGDGLSLLSGLALAGQKLWQAAAGSGLYVRSCARLTDAPQRGLDPGEGVGEPATPRKLARTAHATSRQSTWCGLLSITHYLKEILDA